MPSVSYPQSLPHYPASPETARSLDKSLSNKCPARGKQREISRKLADDAANIGLFHIADRIRRCCTDAAILQRPDGTLTHSVLRCNHRLCPLCAQLKTRALRERLNKVAHRAQLMLTLTNPTPGPDDRLASYIHAQQAALRVITQHHKPEIFGPGYYWHHETTDSHHSFHPHLHVLVARPHVSVELLRSTWATASLSQDLYPGHVWIRKADAAAIYEVSHYLSKGLPSIPSDRWADLAVGLDHARAYGSGGVLRLPPPHKSDYQFVGLLSRWEEITQIRDYALASGCWHDLDYHCSLVQRMTAVLPRDRMALLLSKAA